jgi:hypothetical protein
VQVLTDSEQQEMTQTVSTRRHVLHLLRVQEHLHQPNLELLAWQLLEVEPRQKLQ